MSDPVKFSHRYINKMLSVIMPGKTSPTSEELDRISRVFMQVGGSWVGIIQGSEESISLLKKLLKFAKKNGYLS